MRFERQLAVSQIGESGQAKLRSSHITVIGAGGLGCFVLASLSAAGIGNITIIDGDTVATSNLNRQILYGVSDIGKQKSLLAKQKLLEQYGDIKFVSHDVLIDNDNIDSIIKKDTIILDCVDNFKTRNTVNSFAVKNAIPLIEGGINGFYGFATTIFKGSPCLNCTGFLNVAEQKNVPSIATTAGIIASIMANQALKLILESGELLTGKILEYDGLSGTFDVVEVDKTCKCKF